MTDGGLLSGVLPTVIGAFCGGISGGVGGFFSARHEKKKAVHQREKEVSVYSEPLVHAAFDLQSRIYNIVERHFMNHFYVHGDERTREYCVENTVFLISQLFCWFELTRQELYYIELQNEKDTRQLLHLQDNVQTLWGTDKTKYHGIFCLFAGEQRAIGENLIIRRDGSSSCMGFAQFMDTFPPGKNKQIDILREEISKLGANEHLARVRLIDIQNLLIDLLALLDPKFLRFPQKSRQKMQLRNAR